MGMSLKTRAGESDTPPVDNGFIAGTHILALHAFDGGHHVWNTVIVSLK